MWRLLVISNVGITSNIMVIIRDLIYE
jgi:hypothetical protein